MAAKTIPVLPSADLARTAAFYPPVGFAASGTWPAYLMLVGPEDIELHFFVLPDVDRSTNASNCYIRLDGRDVVRALFETWSSSIAPDGRVTEPRQRDHGTLEFSVVDPDGNLLRIGAT